MGKQSKRQEISSANKMPNTSNLNPQLVSGHFCGHRSTVEKYPWEICPPFLPFPYLRVSSYFCSSSKCWWVLQLNKLRNPLKCSSLGSEDPTYHGHHSPKAFPIFSHLPSPRRKFHGSLSLLATKSPVCFDGQNLAENHPGTRPQAGRVHSFFDYVGHVFSFLPLVHNCSWEGSVWSLCSL